MTVATAALRDDPFSAFHDAVARSRERLRRRRIDELTDLLAALDRQRRDAQDELARLTGDRRGGGET